MWGKKSGRMRPSTRLASAGVGGRIGLLRIGGRQTGSRGALVYCRTLFGLGMIQIYSSGLTCDCQVAVLTVADRPWVGPGRLRTHLHANPGVAVRDRTDCKPTPASSCCTAAVSPCVDLILHYIHPGEVAGGLAWKTPERKKRREPPPAATVLMSNCGAWMVTPAVVLSNTCSYRPAYRETSGGQCKGKVCRVTRASLAGSGGRRACG